MKLPGEHPEETAGCDRGASTGVPGQESRAVVSASVCASLWSFFDERYAADLGSGADRLPRDATAEVMSRLKVQLSRSQISRQWDRWRISRRNSNKSHEHAASLHAHRRRAFGADDTLYNRLQTIAHDANFVKRISTRFLQWPMVANLRCGAWYAPPEAFAANVRFKSTGGAMHVRDLEIKPVG